MKFLTERGLSIPDAWTLRTHLVKRVERRLLRTGPGTARSRPRFTNFFPNLRLIFVHIPKTAGTSVQAYLSRIDEMLEYNGGQAESGAASSNNPFKHLKAHELHAYLGDEIWDVCYRFSFVRNPWDLMVSSYNWWLQKAPNYIHLRKSAAEIKRMGDFGTFIRSRYGSEMINEYFGNQLDWINDGCGDSVHYIGRTETLENDLRRILNYLELNELEPVPVPRLNESHRFDYRSYYDCDTAQLVGGRFAPEIERFGYEF